MTAGANPWDAWCSPVCPDDRPGGYDDVRARADALTDSLCVTCRYWMATVGDQCEACFADECRANDTALRFRLAPAAGVW